MCCSQNPLGMNYRSGAKTSVVYYQRGFIQSPIESSDTDDSRKFLFWNITSAKNSLVKFHFFLIQKTRPYSENRGLILLIILEDANFCIYLVEQRLHFRCCSPRNISESEPNPNGGTPPLRTVDSKPHVEK